MPLFYSLIKPGRHGAKNKGKFRVADRDAAALRTMFADLCYMKRENTDAAAEVHYTAVYVCAVYKL